MYDKEDFNRALKVLKGRVILYPLIPSGDLAVMQPTGRLWIKYLQLKKEVKAAALLFLLTE
jgi:hypothetical protein